MRRGNIWFLLGGLLLAAALGLGVYNLLVETRGARLAENSLKQLVAMMPEKSEQPEMPGQNTSTSQDEISETLEVPDYQLDPGMEMLTVEIDGDRYIGTLEIPALGLWLPVLETWSQELLSMAPCRYAGSVYSNDLVVAGHNFRGHFSGLGSLSQGDTVIFTDVRGNVFRYQVTELEMLGPADVEKMITGDWDLTLFTCTYDSAQRVTVRCDMLT